MEEVLQGLISIQFSKHVLPESENLKHSYVLDSLLNLLVLYLIYCFKYIDIFTFTASSRD